MNDVHSFFYFIIYSLDTVPRGHFHTIDQLLVNREHLKAECRYRCSYSGRICIAVSNLMAFRDTDHSDIPNGLMQAHDRVVNIRISSLS